MSQKKKKKDFSKGPLLEPEKEMRQIKRDGGNLHNFSPETIFPGSERNPALFAQIYFRLFLARVSVQISAGNIVFLLGSIRNGHQ